MSASSPIPPPGVYSSPHLPPDWIWQYSPEADDIFFIHGPSGTSQWDYPGGLLSPPELTETRFYQWLGAELGGGGGSSTAFSSRSGAPLSRALSAPGGTAAEFYNALSPPGPSSWEYSDALGAGAGPGSASGPVPDGVADRGLFSHGFGKPVKTAASSGWSNSSRLKNFFVGDFKYRPPPPRPPAPQQTQSYDKPHHKFSLSWRPSLSSSSHAQGYTPQQQGSLLEEVSGPASFITPFPAPPPRPAQVTAPPPVAASAPVPAPAPPPAAAVPSSPPPSYQQAGAGGFPPYHNPQVFASTSLPPPTSPPLRPPTSPFHPHSPQKTSYFPQTTSPYLYAQQLQPQAQPQAPPQPQPHPYPPPGPSPVMSALAQQPGAPPAYASSSMYAPRPSEGYMPGRINAGAFKPRPRGEGDDDDWGQEGGQEEQAPACGQPGAQWGSGSGQWR